MKRVTLELVADIFELARADVGAKGFDVQSQVDCLDALEQRVRAIFASNQPLATKDLAISGTHLIEELGLAPGPVIGRLLRSLLDEVLEAPERNERERLLDRARELLKVFAADSVDSVSKFLGD
jgi:tRNA nucleotidyltransferase (CCA-adding enzyme)